MSDNRTVLQKTIRMGEIEKTVRVEVDAHSVTEIAQWFDIINLELRREPVGGIDDE